MSNGHLVIGEAPIIVAASNAYWLLGPNLRGIIGMSGLIVGAFVMNVRLNYKLYIHGLYQIYGNMWK